MSERSLQEINLTYIGESMMSNKKVIYQVFHKDLNILSFPYPPLYVENDIDYICFADSKSVESNFWQMHYVEDFEQFDVKDALAGYTEIFEIKSNQILVGALTDGGNSILTVPGFEELPNISFDISKFSSTKGKNGEYFHTPNPIYLNGNYDGHPLLLTIGVPVSNQIKTIDRCLSCIKPLLDGLDAELLVINTGSTDGTLEICRNYGAKIVEFPWCDNMSAARNYGIYHAKGAWYLSIDDDEWFENVDDILEFFQSGKYEEYEAATYIQRNYHSRTGVQYSDNHTLRLAKITPELHFEGRIHDAMTISPESRCCSLFSYVHHYGFAKDDAGKRKEKYIRNVSILLYDVFEYPENLRYNFQLAKELNGNENYAEAYAYCIRGLSIEKERPDIYYGKNHAIFLLAVLRNAEDERLFHMGELLEPGYAFTVAEKAFIQYIQMELAWKQQASMDKVLKYVSQYEHFLAEFQKNPEDSLQKAVVGLEVCTNLPCIMDARVIAFGAYCKQNKMVQALKQLEQIIPEEIYEQRKNFFEHSMNANDIIFEAAWKKITPVQCELWFSELMEAFLTKNTELGSGMEKQKRLSEILSHCSIRRISEYLGETWDSTDRVWKDILVDYAMKVEIERLSIQELYFYAVVLQHQLRERTDEEQHLEVFLQYVQIMGQFVAAYFCPELLADKSNLAIPGEMRAAYEICEALGEKQVTVQTVSHLRNALEYFPGFKKEIQMLLNILAKGVLN